jgi:RNA polymerase sigma factor (sigma-70 family)
VYFQVERLALAGINVALVSLRIFSHGSLCLSANYSAYTDWKQSCSEMARPNIGMLRRNGLEVTTVQEMTCELNRSPRPAGLDGAIEPGPPRFDAGYLQRLRNGDDETARHFDRHFRRLIRARVWGRFNQQLQQDLIDDVMATAIENIMRGELRDAARLPGYIFGILSNSTKRALRPTRRDADFVQLDFDRLSDGAETTDRRIEEREEAEAVSKTLRTLSDRDREVLVDLYYRELSRTEVCEKYRVTHEQLRLILFYAIRRFQKKWANSHATEKSPS